MIAIPLSVFASGSANFSGSPQVSVTSVQGGYQPTVSGQITVQGVTEDDFFVGLKIFQGNTPPTEEQINSNEALTFLSTIASGSGYFFNASSEYILMPGTSYYFVFKIIPNTGVDILPSSVVVNITTQGSGSTPPDGSTPPCEGCAIDTTAIDSGVFPGWPNEAIDNPLEVDNLNNFIANLLNAFLKIAIPILALFLIYSGLKFVMARGNEKELETAKQNLLWTVVGGTILLGAWTIVKILKGTVEELDITLINSLVNYFV